MITDEEKRKRVAAMDKAYREANRLKILATKRAYYAANREKVLAKRKAYTEANREKELANRKAYREANREKVLAGKMAYREANLEKVRFQATVRSEDLRDDYVAKTMSMKVKDCPPDLLELKREQLRMHRLTKQLNNALREKEQ